MSKAKKNTKTSAAKSSRKDEVRKEENYELLDCLNYAFSQLQEKQSDLFAAMDRDDIEAVARLKKTVDDGYEKFMKLRHELPDLKFDRHSGKYFFAYDYDGTEIFHILCEAKVQKVVHVGAKDAKEACEKAARLIDNDNMCYCGASAIDFKDVSQMG